jgi:hypothetical protein
MSMYFMVASLRYHRGPPSSLVDRAIPPPRRTIVPEMDKMFSRRPIPAGTDGAEVGRVG